MLELEKFDELWFIRYDNLFYRNYFATKTMASMVASIFEDHWVRKISDKRSDLNIKFVSNREEVRPYVA